MITIEEAVSIYLTARRANLSKTTRDMYRRYVLDLAEFLENPVIEEVTIRDLRSYMSMLLDKKNRWEDHPMRPMEEGGLARTTINKMIRAIKTFFKWMTDEEYLDKNPARRLIPPDPAEKPPKEISREDALKMLMYTKKYGTKRDYAILRFLADSTIRAYGVATLQIENLDLVGKKALVYYKGKNGHKQQRYVHFKSCTSRALQDYLEERGTNSCPEFFIGLRGPMTPRGIYGILDRIAEGAGVEGPHGPHSFRHAWAMNAARAGADTATIQREMGHKTPKTTIEHYINWVEQELGERHDTYSWVPDDDYDYEDVVEGIEYTGPLSTPDSSIGESDVGESDVVEGIEYTGLISKHSPSARGNKDSRPKMKNLKTGGIKFR